MCQFSSIRAVSRLRVKEDCTMRVGVKQGVCSQKLAQASPLCIHLSDSRLCALYGRVSSRQGLSAAGRRGSTRSWRARWASPSSSWRCALPRNLVVTMCKPLVSVGLHEGTQQLPVFGLFATSCPLHLSLASASWHQAGLRSMNGLQSQHCSFADVGYGRGSR